MPPLDFDGNVVVGDATAGGETDRGPRDAANLDQGPVDVADAGAADEGIERESDAGLDAAAPDLGCNMPPDETVTATEAIANAALLENHVVAIIGTSTSTELSCMHQTCADGGMCCDMCSSAVAIDRTIPLLPSACFVSPGCSGSECAQVCRPPVLGVRQTFRGTLVRTDGGVRLELLLVEP